MKKPTQSTDEYNKHPTVPPPSSSKKAKKKKKAPACHQQQGKASEDVNFVSYTAAGSCMFTEHMTMNIITFSKVKDFKKGHTNTISELTQI